MTWRAGWTASYSAKRWHTFSCVSVWLLATNPKILVREDSLWGCGLGKRGIKLRGVLEGEDTQLAPHCFSPSQPAAVFCVLRLVCVWYVLVCGDMACVHACVWRLVLDVFLNCSLLILRQGFSLNLELTHWLGWPANEHQGSACLCLPSTGVIDILVGFSYGFWGSDHMSSCLGDRHFPHWVTSPALQYLLLMGQLKEEGASLGQLGKHLFQTLGLHFEWGFLNTRLGISIGARMYLIIIPTALRYNLCLWL